jgi:hypothetical protein
VCTTRYFDKVGFLRVRNCHHGRMGPKNPENELTPERFEPQFLEIFQCDITPPNLAVKRELFPKENS